MVMKMKRRSSLDISVAESEAKLDASACHSLNLVVLQRLHS
jgi:hypothetical protein